MNRRAFISKTTLTALAAPLLPAALAKAPRVAPLGRWSCIALCRNGIIGSLSMHTCEISSVLWFIEHFTEPDAFHRIEIYREGKLFHSYNLHANWIPIFFKRQRPTT